MLMSGSLINFDQFHDTDAIKQKAMMNAASGGPNSGFEIEGADFFKQPELANEFPEMKEDIDLIVSTESFVARLVDFRHRVIAARGMNRSMAVELLELMPSLESHTTTRHFTEDLSMIGCDWSLEAIDLKLWGIIAAAIAFVAALIYKFMDWLGFGGGGNGGTGDLNQVKEGVKNADKNLAQQDKAITETMKLVRHTNGDYIEVKVPDHDDLKKIAESDLPEPLKKEIVRTTKQLGTGPRTNLDEKEHYIKVKLSDVLADLEGGAAVYDYLRKPNKWARIIYQDKSYALEMVTSAFEAFKSGASIVLGNIGVMEELIKDLETLESGTDSMGKMAPGARVSSALDVMDMAMLNTGDFKVGGKSYPSLPHWAVEVKNATNDPSEYRPFFTDLEDLLVSHEDAMRRLRNVNFGGILDFIDALQKAEPTLRRFDRIAKSEEARERNGMTMHDKARGERAQVLFRVATQVAKNFDALMMVYGIIAKVYEEASMHGTMIVEKLRSNAKKIVAFYNKHKEHAPPTLEKLVDDLEEQLKVHREHEMQARMLPPSVSVRDIGTSHIVIDDKEIQVDYHAAQQALQQVTRKD
jgi:hypothetical protein